MATRTASDSHGTSNGTPGTSVFTQRGFTITTRKLPILKAEPIDEMSRKLGIAVPEMIFGDNLVSIEHASSGWSIAFNAFNALDRVDKTGEAMLSVAHSEEWQRSREHYHEGIKEVVKPFDWSYSTDYKGTVNESAHQFQASEQAIPVELLKRADPILFFDDVVLYEDELADNGIAMLSCKIRVMAERLLLLSRFFMRLDGVMFRVRDTRVYIELTTGQVIREYTARQADYETVRQRLAVPRDHVPALMRDANQLVPLIPVVERCNEAVTLPMGLKP